MSKQLFGYDYSNNEKVKLFFYLLVGGTGALIEWSLVYIFTEKVGINYLVATALAYFCSTVCHYFATNFLVFESGKRYAKGKEFSLVLFVSTIGLLLNVLLMRIFVGAFSGPLMPSKILATALVTVWNYLSRKKWIY